MHSSMHSWHIAMHALSIDIIVAMSMPCMRIMARIIVLHMSAVFMHAAEHDIICVEHTVQACSQAEQASIHACMSDMSIVSMPGIIFMSLDIMSIIIESIANLFGGVLRRVSQSVRCASRHAIAADGLREDLARVSSVSSQRIHKLRRARPFAVLAAAALAAASVLLATAPASAHDELVSTAPAAGSTLETLPAELTLTFSGVLATDAGTSEVAVTDAAGTSLADGAPVVADTVLTQPLTGEASGVVTVLWKVVSSDGHPISGEFSFTVTAPAPTETATPTPTQSETAAPTAEPTPTATPAPPAGDETTDLRPWFIGALLLLLAVAGAVMYLLISRARRERALAAGSRTAPESTAPASADPSADPSAGPSVGPSEPGSEPSADR